ncbi:hypothetical protein QAD02_003265 [Eretmocerus hayati]|uniref:Uncharacterized protein n=1 Tax=Eretmocerus hayati TaxID=131215 RepID=A0ACC2NLK9_9HYME|nr:hypothetical protein QAD02_003265 [Eretmocerus hayati]
MEVVVDVQWFRRSQDVICIKQLAYSRLHDQTDPTVIHSQPPCDWEDLDRETQSKNLFLQMYHHGLFWYQGEQPYDTLPMKCDNIKHLSEDRQIIVYVKDEQKKLLLGPFFERIIHVEDVYCPELEYPLDEVVKCPHHRSWAHCCSSVNVKLIKNWILSNSVTLTSNFPIDIQEGIVDLSLN